MISITKSPLIYSPVNSPIVFTLSGSTSDLLLFRIELVESSTLTPIYVGNVYPTPVNPSVASVNLSNQLSSLVKPDIDNKSTLVTGKTKNIIGFKLLATEYGVSGGTLTSLGTTYTGGTYYAFEGDLDNFNYSTRYTGSTYLINSGSTGHFLTLQPDYKEVNDYSTEQLYFLQSGYTGLTVSVQVGSSTFNNSFSTSGNTMFRIQTSPKVLKSNGITGFTNNIPYSVKIKNNGGTTISEVKNYLYTEDECNLDYVNIAFTNSLGGIDTYQFINPQESLNVTKLNVTKNNINLDGSSIYSTGGVYNVSDETYHTQTKSSIKVYTKSLTDNESDWLSELVKSKNIYIELADGNLVPVQLTTTNYSIQKKKYTTELNQYQFDFSFSDNFLPAMSTAGIIINK